MTECNEERFEFASTSGTRQIVAEFSGGTITSDAGSLLLKETDAKMNLLAPSEAPPQTDEPCNGAS
jgi:hypothetical protein